MDGEIKKLNKFLNVKFKIFSVSFKTHETIFWIQVNNRENCNSLFLINEFAYIENIKI